MATRNRRGAAGLVRVASVVAGTDLRAAATARAARRRAHAADRSWSPPRSGRPSVDGARPADIGRAPRGRAGSPNVSAGPVEAEQTVPIPPVPPPSRAAVPWATVRAPEPESWWRRARRLAVLAVAGILVLAGVVNIAGTLTSWLRPPATTTAVAGPAVSDTQWSGTATTVALDYLSWDTADRPDRQTALNALAAAGTSIDGWDGTGRQWAAAASAIGIVRVGATAAVVTVRVRVTPFTATSAGTSVGGTTNSTAGAAVSSAPVLSAPGWTPLQARWINLAVALAEQAGQLLVTAPPAVVGSPPTSAPAPAVPGDTAPEDSSFEQGSQGILGVLLQAYGTGDLAYARAAGTDFTGLDGAASLVSVGAWHVAPVTGGQASTRVGDATVTWALSGGAGQLTCSYRIVLALQDGRWYLGQITAETTAVT